MHNSLSLQEGVLVMGKGNTKRRKKRRRRSRAPFFACLLVAAVLIVLKFTAGHQSVDVEKLRDENCPESLIELAEKNPEAINFVRNYAKNAGKKEEIDISGEVHRGKIPLFIQWDERWGYEQYGDDFLAVTGCGPTCLSMVYCGLTGNTQWNPYEMALYAEEHGFYVSGSGSSWYMMSDMASSLGLTVHTVTFDKQHVLSELENGRPIICIMGPGDFTTGGHFIVMTGVSEEGKIRINDPNSRKNSEKTWEFDDIQSQIRNLWSYSVE